MSFNQLNTTSEEEKEHIENCEDFLDNMNEKGYLQKIVNEGIVEELTDEDKEEFEKIYNHLIPENDATEEEMLGLTVFYKTIQEIRNNGGNVNVDVLANEGIEIEGDHP